VSPPRRCRACDAKPVANAKSRYCFDCRPGGPHVPPPCRKCGSIDGYYSAGLCSRCHQYAPQPVESCRDCLAWGVTRTLKWLCGGCQMWRRLHFDIGPCTSCGTIVAVNEHRVCRLCWRQAKPLKRRGQHRDIDTANRHGQQLFFADMHSFKTNRPLPRPAPTLIPSDAGAFHQPGLFDRDRIADSARRFGYPDPDPAIAALLDRCAVDHAARHGWKPVITRRTRVALRVLIGMRATSTTPIPASDIAALAEHGLPVRAVRAVLTEAGLVTDEDPSLHAWFERHIATLPAPMAGDLRQWFDVMHHGSTTTPPRRRPRSAVTTKVMLLWAKPTLDAFAAAGHRSLREISRSDVTGALPASGDPRYTAGRGLRSIFAVLKARRVVFANPMARVDIGTHSRPAPLPLAADDLREGLRADDPARAALTALIAFHGLQPAEVRDLQLVDIRDGRLRLSNRTVPLAGPVKSHIGRYLDYRARRWPNTINAHLFVTSRSALSTEPVSRHWVNRTLGQAAQSIRRDRIVDEVLAGSDIRRICDLFGITVGAAEHYTRILDHPGLNISNDDIDQR
jgi:integrase